MTEALSILSLSPGWIAVEKPAGMSVHNGENGGPPDVLQTMGDMLRVDDELRDACDWSDLSRLSPVHRLDIETSGVLLLATDRESAARLQNLFETRAAGLKKTYLAVVRGRIEKAVGAEFSEWTQALSDRAEGRQNPAGLTANRKECRTRYQVLRGNEFLTEIEVDLLTGRQHQIRRHAVLNRHAVAGDTRYGDAKALETLERFFGFSRLMLHASRLEFRLRDEDLVVIETARPPEFDRVFEPPRSK